MYYNRTTNRKINGFFFNDKQSSFKKLLEKDSSVSIRNRNSQYLSVEMVSNGLSVPLISDISKRKNNHFYNQRHNSQSFGPLVKTVTHGSGSISYLGSVIWVIFPVTYTGLCSLEAFKNRIKKWKSEKYTCRLYKTYVARVGFIKKKPWIILICSEKIWENLLEIIRWWSIFVY